MISVGALLNRLGGSSSSAMGLQQFELTSVEPIQISDVIAHTTSAPTISEGAELFNEDITTSTTQPTFLSLEIPYVQISTTGYVIATLFIDSVIHSVRAYRVTTGATSGNSIELNTVFVADTTSTNIQVRIGVSSGSVVLGINTRFGGLDTPKLNVVGVSTSSGGSTPPPEPTPDLLAKFDAILSTSQFQGDFASGQNRVTYEGGSLLSRPNNQYFYFDPVEGTMVFEGVRNSSFQFRSELRHQPEWRPNTFGKMTIDLELDDTDVGEHTFAQIHRKAVTSVPPPVRFVLGKQATIGGVVYNNYIFAVVRRHSGTYQNIPLFAKPVGRFVFDAEIDDDVMTLRKDGDIVHTESVSDWSGYNLYFKLGLYLSGSTTISGTAKATFHDVSVNVPNPIN